MQLDTCNQQETPGIHDDIISIYWLYFVAALGAHGAAWQSVARLDHEVYVRCAVPGDLGVWSSSDPKYTERNTQLAA